MPYGFTAELTQEVHDNNVPCCRQTVLNAPCFRNNSETAKLIRRLAIEKYHGVIVEKEVEVEV